ncbi:hypothetical protein COU88_03265 [Candidatus Roizmanbacteria bacterium CG10_big_fil_rev_8_21_14_0_10_39_6]|uniref:Ribonuclease VapC n=1 Tax=Candidatus Roizmanbacteria bacterium CG10_big_fil_rev_8_21_14_0_10_39_6 TaxID=1974853 RepID=A0A2M8KS74_9BACT|nr:MAG: hypothetical protein COU88_03265 [Candidatus Roizmanbacteria bacterium CG10_big_fil_rev_8_21_14_0_10_39_6]
MVILDTSVIIDHLRRSVEESVLVKLFERYPSETFALSVISVQGLYEGMSTKNEKKENYMLSTVSTLEIVPYTVDIATKAGKIARDLETPIDLADAAIAATCIQNDVPLYTLNTKHFRTIPTLIFFQPVDFSEQKR